MSLVKILFKLSLFYCFIRLLAIKEINFIKIIQNKNCFIDMSGQQQQTYKIFKYAVEGKSSKVKDILKKGSQSKLKSR